MLAPAGGFRQDRAVPPRRPFFVMTASALSFALMAFAAKLACRRLPGDEVAFVRFLFMLLPLVLVPGAWRGAWTFQRLDLLLYRGIFGGVAVLLYFLAIAHVPVGLATLLNYSSPIWSVLFASIFLGERADRRLLLPGALALAGLVLAAGVRPGAGLRLGWWEAGGFLSAILSGAAVASIRAARRTEGSWAIYASFTLFGLLVSAPFALHGFVAPNRVEWILLAAVGAASVMAQLLMTWAYRWLSNLQAGILAQLTVVVSLMVGWAVLGDRLTALQWAGCGLALGGVIAVVALQSVPRAVE
jgi:drug/metabolite transporter (DMT)-like permease